MNTDAINVDLLSRFYDNLKIWLSQNYVSKSEPVPTGSDMKVITCIMNDLTTPILTEYTYNEIMTWINSGKGLSLNIRTISPDNNQISLCILSNFEIYHVSGEPSWLVGKISIMGTDSIVQIEKAESSDYMQVTLQPDTN